MKKTKILQTILFIFLSNLIFPQSIYDNQLEEYNFYNLCKTFMTENLNIKEAELLEKKAKTEKNATLALLLPALSIEGGLFYAYENFQKEYPCVAEISGAVNQYFLGGSNLKISGQFLYSSKEANTPDYEPSASASMYLQQSLCPYWLSFGAKNPDFYIPKQNYNYALENKKYTNKILLNDFLLQFLEYKTIFKKKKIANMNKDIYTEYHEAGLKMYSKGNITFQNLQDINQKYYATIEEYESIIIEMNTCINNFSKLLNYKYDFSAMQSWLELCVEEPWEMIFTKLFPEWNYDEILKNESNMKNIELNIQKSKYLLQRQNLAPKLIIGADCEYDVENKHTFSVSLGLDFSNLFSPANLTQKKEYKIEKSILLEKKSLSENYNQTIKDTYLQKLDLLTAKYNYLSEEYNSLEKIYKDYQMQYKRGNCSKLDLKNMELLVEESKMKLDNCADNISYYSLLLNIEIYK